MLNALNGIKEMKKLGVDPLEMMKSEGNSIAPATKRNSEPATPMDRNDTNDIRTPKVSGILKEKKPSEKTEQDESPEKVITEFKSTFGLKTKGKIGRTSTEHGNIKVQGLDQSSNNIMRPMMNKAKSMIS